MSKYLLLLVTFAVLMQLAYLDKCIPEYAEGCKPNDPTRPPTGEDGCCHPNACQWFGVCLFSPYRASLKQ
nr:venom polypeptide precursor [Doratifera vulnerans]